MKAKVFTPPSIIESDRKSVFLAGTIDMGSSINWQEETIEALKDYDINIYNPRRYNWDNSWKQEIENVQFKQQVVWELNALDMADIIIMNFLPDSKSPISLLELGLYAKSKKVFVCCPKEFYRSGNIHIVCERYKIPLFKNMTELLNNLKIDTYFINKMTNK